VGVPQSLAGTPTSSASTPVSTPIPAAAAAPVWQPWVETHAKAQSALKTQINVANIAFNRDMADAQRLLDAAESIATHQTRELEAAAWAAWHKYMQEANAIHDAVMKPALTAYEQAVEQAHERANTLIYRAQAAYDKAKHITIYSRDTATGSDTF
jgi:hypothetical protein